MRILIFLWISLGLFILLTLPVTAEFDLDKMTIKIDSTEGKEIEKDFYCYSDWKLKHFRLDLTNKFSWPEHNENYFGFNVKAHFEEYKQLKLNMDYRWNERYRILSPEIKYQFELGPNLTIGLEYENNTRTPVLNEDRNLKYRTDSGSAKMELNKNNWSYDLELAHTRKDYPRDEVKNSTKNQLDQKLSWKVQPNLNLHLSYYETTSYYPYDIEISQDYWSSEVGIGSEYRFNDRWQMTGAFSAKEVESGLVPYLDQQYLDIKLKNKPTKDVTVNLRIGSKQMDYYS